MICLNDKLRQRLYPSQNGYVSGQMCDYLACIVSELYVRVSGGLLDGVGV